MGHNKCSFLTPGVTFRLHPRLYLQIAQVRLDCAVTLSQALVPTVPALVTHRNITGRWRIIHHHWHPIKPCAKPSPGSAGDVPALTACCWKWSGVSRKCQSERAGGSKKVKINPNLAYWKIFSRNIYKSCFVL